MKRGRAQKRKRNSVYSAYESSWKYVKESRKFIWTAAVAFILAGIIGFVFAPQLKEFIEPLLKDILGEVKDLKGFEMILFIFINNVKSAFLSMALGIFFGILPFVNAVTNGAILGYVFNVVWGSSGAREFWRILPHGVFELPAIFISLGLGMKLGMFIFSENKLDELKKRLWKSVLAFLLIAIPLLVLAAIIEGLLIGIYR